MLEVVAYASSGETEFLIDSQKNFVCHRSLWANQYAPEGMGCPEIGPSGKDLIPGAIFVPAPLQNSSVTFLNGFPVSRSAYLGAIRPGAHGIIHHERGWSQHQSIASANDFDEGLIVSTDHAK